MAKGKPKNTGRDYSATYARRNERAKALGYSSYYQQRKHRVQITKELTARGKSVPNPRTKQGSKAWRKLERRIPWSEKGVTFYRDQKAMLKDHPRSETRKIAPFKSDAINFIKEIGGQGYFIILIITIDGEDYFQPYFDPDPAVDAGWDPASHRMK